MPSKSSGWRERFAGWLAYRLPRRLVYWCGMRLWVNGTTGRYGTTEAPALTVNDALDRWRS